MTASASASSKCNNNGDDDDDKKMIIIHCMPGSQYSAKVLAALDARKIPHCVNFVDINPSKRNLPSGGTMVPELQVLNNDKEVALPDSEDILHWLDDHYNTNFFPSDEISRESQRASDGILSGAVLYYNWVDDDGYAKSMRQSLGKQLPSFVLFFRDAIVDYFAADSRKAFGVKAAKGLGVQNDEDLADEPKIYKMLVQELLHFQSLLDQQPYMLSGDDATAADFSIYAQLERLVGDMGDADVPPSMPQLLENQDLKRLWQWQKHMRQTHPVKFKGKRVPSKL